MNWNDDLRLELEALLNTAADEKLTPEANARLQEILHTSEDARRHYVRFAHLEVSLAAYAGEAQVQEELPRVVRFPAAKAIAWGSAAAAAIALWAGVQFFASSTQKPSVAGVETDAEDGGEPAATLLAADHCLWAADSVVKQGDVLRQGQRLMLETGVAELNFDCGARLVMQGPSELLLHSPWEAHLVKGLVRANVPAEAIGFRVTSQEVDVVDLGTEFSVSADNISGESDVLVHEGKVQVKARTKEQGTPGKKALLLQNQGRRFVKNGSVRDVPAGDAKWQALAGKLRPIRGLVKGDAMLWTFDPIDTLLPTFAELAKNAPPLATTATLVPGKHGLGLTFTENGQTHRLSVPTSHGKHSTPNALEARSYAAWVKVDPSANLADAGTWLAHAPQFSIPGEVALSWNGNPTRGVLGAGSMRFGNRNLVGSTPLNDGKWHHVTAIYVVRQKTKQPGLDVHMRLYVDGKLETASAKTRLKTNEALATTSPPGQLLLGNDPTSTDPFLGQLDEVLLVERPLSNAEMAILVQESGRKASL